MPRDLPSLTKRAAIAAAICAAVAIAVIAFICARGDREPEPRFLSLLPDPGELPCIIVDARDGEFPLDAARALFDGAAALTDGGSPLAAMAPILAAASESSLVVVARESGLCSFGAISLRDDELAAIEALTLPDEWRRHLTQATFESTDPDLIRCTIGAAEMQHAIVIDIDRARRAAFIADLAADADAMRDVREGRAQGITIKLDEYGEWGGHAMIRDGGLLARSLGAGERAAAIEMRWRTIDRRGQAAALTEDPPSGEMRWRAYGASESIGESFMRSLAPRDRSHDAMFTPEPLICAFGIDLPDPGRRINELPQPLQAAASHLERMGLRQAEIRALLTGPAILSLGGRTQVLWFDLPGIVLDLPGRGAASRRLIDAFWTDTFLGVEPDPIDGYDIGGAISLPFSVMAAMNEDTAVIGLTTPDAELSTVASELLADGAPCIAWLYADLPRLGSALAEMPSFNAILNGEEGLPMEDEVTASVQEAITRLGRVFITLDAQDSGRLLWYER